MHHSYTYSLLFLLLFLPKAVNNSSWVGICVTHTRLQFIFNHTAPTIHLLTLSMFRVVPRRMNVIYDTFLLSIATHPSMLPHPRTIPITRTSLLTHNHSTTDPCHCPVFFLPLHNGRIRHILSVLSHPASLLHSFSLSSVRCLLIIYSRLHQLVYSLG